MTIRIAYLVNQYPKVSHSFIRTEIVALEQQGLAVERIAMRGWDAEVVDALDADERTRTRYVLQRGALPLVRATIGMAMRRPGCFFAALRAIWDLSRGGERGFSYHLIYLAEACLVLGWLIDSDVGHVHAHFGSNATTVALLVRLLGGPPYSFTVHGPEEFDKPLQLKLREKIRGAAFVVAITSFCRSQLYRWSDPRDWDKVAVVHCAIDPRFAAATRPTAPVMTQLVCVGRLCEQKGQLLLVEAVAVARSRGVDVALVLAGDGEMRGHVECAVVAAGLEDHVTITGWIGAEDVRHQLEQAVALVLPSFGEGLPVAIMEAMARYRPVLTTAIAGIPELVRDGIDGLVIPAGDVALLADAIERLLTMDDATREKMGSSAAARVRERHTAPVEAAKLAALFSRSVTMP